VKAPWLHTLVFAARVIILAEWLWFDRWDTCFLLSGHFVTYISDAVKDELRPYKGKAMQIDASDVFQPN